MVPPLLPSGHKFAVLAVTESRAGAAPDGALNLGHGLGMSRMLPAESLRTWREQLGTIHIDELAECNLFLWALAPSDAPEVLDHENIDLQKQVYRLYLGLLLSVPYIRHGRLTSLTGASTDAATVRSLTWHAPTFYTLGSPRAPITLQRARDAASIARALSRHATAPAHRMVRALRAFRRATEAPELDIRLHQFVRVIEAFIAPPFGKSARHFADRFAMLNRGHGRPVALELYQIRSAIEHLRGPSDGMTKRPREGKRRRLIRRTIEAETIARYLLFTYFSNRALWPHLRSRAAVDALWTRSAPELRLAFGEGIPMRAVAAAINWNDPNSRR